jgi:hypothetical protein
MKQSITYQQDTIATKPQVCSEQTCITCFENRGCIYDQYMIAIAYSIEESYTSKKIEPVSPEIHKQA